MRRLFAPLLLALLVACNSQLDTDRGSSARFSLPERVTINGFGGSLPLAVGSRTAWKVTPMSDWLEAIPAQGVGPRTVTLRVKPEVELADIPEYTGMLEVSGDIEGLVEVRLPLVRVTGRVGQPAATAQSRAQVGALGLAPATSEPSPRGNEILVKYRPGAQPQALSGVRTLSRDRASGIVKLTSPDPQGLLRRLRSDPAVAWAEPNGTVRRQGEPTDQFFPLQWHLRSTGARFSHLGSFTRPVTVAVIDSGVRYDHPDLSGRLILPSQGAYDFVKGDSDPTDTGDQFSPREGSHGTHVTGLVVANTGEFPTPCPDCSPSGVVGVAHSAPVKVLPLRVLDERGDGSFESVALALRYAAGLPVTANGQALQNPVPADVINLSLGSSAFSRAMCDAVAEAAARGVLVVAAAGNYQNDPGQAGKAFYPASCPGAISVGAVDANNRTAYYSQQNSEVMFAAPGGDTGQDANRDGYPDGIFSTTWNFNTNQPNYTFYMGTSQASPQVAAALALVLSSGAVADGPSALARLRATATDLGKPGRDNVYGVGMVGLPAALGWPLPPGGYGYSLRLAGASPRQIAIPDGVFQTYLVPGTYGFTVCRDDSGNNLCDPGEPASRQDIAVPSQAEFDVGALPTAP